MNAAETIQAAIDKLETFAGERWVHKRSPDTRWWVSSGDRPVTEAVSLSDAVIIVTLHRTIDAQLAILRGAVGGARDVDENATPDEPAATLHAFKLARAILGEDAS